MLLLRSWVHNRLLDGKAIRIILNCIVRIYRDNKTIVVVSC